MGRCSHALASFQGTHGNGPWRPISHSTAGTLGCEGKREKEKVILRYATAGTKLMGKREAWQWLEFSESHHSRCCHSCMDYNPEDPGVHSCCCCCCCWARVAVFRHHRRRLDANTSSRKALPVSLHLWFSFLPKSPTGGCGCNGSLAKTEIFR